MNDASEEEVALWNAEGMEYEQRDRISGQHWEAQQAAFQQDVATGMAESLPEIHGFEGEMGHDQPKRDRSVHRKGDQKAGQSMKNLSVDGVFGRNSEECEELEEFECCKLKTLK